MDSLFLLQFACFIFMLINAFIVALSHLHVRWENKRYERSRWMIVVALIGLAIQYVIQMGFGFRAADDSLGAVVNILVYTPCFSLISMGIYNIEATRSNLRKMILMCSGIYAAIIVAFCVGISLHHSLYIREGLYLMLTLFCVSVFYCIYMIIQEMIRRKNMLETMAATDLLPYVRYSRASVIILWLAVLAMPVAIFSTTLLYIVGQPYCLPCCSSTLRLLRSAAVIFQQKSYWIKKRKANKAERKNLYSNCLRSAETLSKTVLTNGVWIWAIRIVM